MLQRENLSETVKKQVSKRLASTGKSWWAKPPVGRGVDGFMLINDVA